jgi:hypothetical protein
VRKITIGVPDELAEDLDEFRDEVNVSQVCAMALRQHITQLQELRNRAMRYDHTLREDWLNWIMSPATRDATAIQHALESVPGEHWVFVDSRLRRALHDARVALLPPVFSNGQPVQYRRYSDDDMEDWRTLDMKKGIFFEEVNARRRGGPRDITPVIERQRATSSGIVFNNYEAQQAIDRS